MSHRSAGFVLDPQQLGAVLSCSWAYDAGTVQIACDHAARANGCIPGCRSSATETWCESPQRTDSQRFACAWGADSLSGMLTKHEAREESTPFAEVGNYNELILAPRHFRALLPSIVAAIFFYARSSRAHATEVRDAFVQEYQLLPRDVPLLELQGTEYEAQTSNGKHPWFVIDGPEPFRLAEGELYE
jgi:hypothetical protein